jgi:hypothetical protein
MVGLPMNDGGKGLAESGCGLTNILFPEAAWKD